MANIIQTFPKGNGTDLSIVAEEFDDTKDYKVGDKVIKDKKYYVFTSDHDAGAWDSSDVDETNVSEEIPVGLTDEDMDEIKAQFHPVRIGNVTPMQIYSPVEHQVGWWQEEISGVLKQKPLYEKTIACGTMPNNTTKEVDIGVSNLDRIFSIKGETLHKTLHTSNPLPYSHASDLKWQVQLYYLGNNEKLQIVTKGDWTDFEAYVIIQYTKTTDEWEEV